MSNPSKEQVKRWIEDRAKEHKPLPSQAEIRRQIGFDLVEAQREKDLPLRREP
jgi:hypothetical protein